MTQIFVDSCVDFEVAHLSVSRNYKLLSVLMVWRLPYAEIPTLKGRDMSWHDFVSAQTSNVCITHHVALNTIVYIVEVKHFVMSFPANLLGDRFIVSRKGVTGGGGLVYTPKGENSMAVCGFGCKNPSVGSLQMVLESNHLTSQGLHAVFKFIS